jgi:hypothetical protein
MTKDEVTRKLAKLNQIMYELIFALPKSAPDPLPQLDLTTTETSVPDNAGPL